MAQKFQKLKYKNLTLCSGKEAQIYGASVLPPPAKMEALMSFESNLMLMKP